MRRKRYLVLGLGILAAVAIGLIGLSTVGASHGAVRSYEVTITNLTRGQIISPSLVATHDTHLAPLYKLGSPASSELASIAEGAINGPLEALWAADPSVSDLDTVFGAGGPILPGESASVVVETTGRFDRISVVGMLVTTNDAFFAVSYGALPNRGAKRFRSPAYDAGSEANNELCAFIPGPPCGNPEVPDLAGAEGYVHVHAGIHGVGDLDPAEHDWRNPVAQIKVRRVPTP